MNLHFWTIKLTIPHRIAFFINVLSLKFALNLQCGKLDTLLRKLAANAASEGISYVLNIRNFRHQVRH